MSESLTEPAPAEDPQAALRSTVLSWLRRNWWWAIVFVFIDASLTELAIHLPPGMWREITAAVAVGMQAVQLFVIPPASGHPDVPAAPR